MTSANAKILPLNQSEKAVPASYNFSRLRNVLTDMHATKTLREIADELSKSGVRISHAVVQRVIAGKEPKRNDIRRALGLPTTRTVRANPVSRWADLPVGELRRAIENRREYP